MNLSGKTIGFLGAGNMAEALIKGLISSGKVSPAQVLASDKSLERTTHLAEAYELRVLNQNYEAVKDSDIVFLTVKPNHVEEVLREIAGEMRPEKLLISVAAGVRTTRVLDVLTASGTGELPALVRAMPNTPATVGVGATALYAAEGAGKEALGAAKEVFDSVGKTVVVTDEGLMDAVTGLSGSGPAYVFLFMEALVEAGVEAGLPERDALVLAAETTRGAARLAAESGVGLAELRRRVSSPGGTTVEGLKVLDSKGFKEAIKEAVAAAAERSRELSGG